MKYQVGDVTIVIAIATDQDLEVQREEEDRDRDKEIVMARRRKIEEIKNQRDLEAENLEMITNKLIRKCLIY